MYRRTVGLLALLAIVVSMPALGDSIIFDLLHHDDAVRRIRYAVEKLGADPNGGIEDGDHLDTPLCVAPMVEIAEELVRLGAIVRGRGDESLTLFQCAIDHGRDPNLIGWLRDELGLDIDQPNKDGMTPLCTAAEHRSAAEVTALLDNGADPTATSRHPNDPSTERDPLACALTNSRPWSEVIQIIEVLESAGSAAPESPETPAEVLPGVHPLVMVPLTIVSQFFGGISFPVYTPPSALDAPPPLRLPPEPPHFGRPPPALLAPKIRFPEVRTSTQVESIDVDRARSTGPSSRQASRIVVSTENDLSFEGVVMGYTGSFDDVEVLLEGAGILRSTTPDSSGTFRFYELPDGDYTVKVRSIGYRPPPARTIKLDTDRHEPSAASKTNEFVLTRLDAAGSAFLYHWEADGTTAGTEYAAHVNAPVDVHLLEDPIRLPDQSSALKLLHDYNIRLVDSPTGEWTQEHAYRLLHTMKSIPQPMRDPYDRQNLAPTSWLLTSDHLAHDIRVDVTKGRSQVTVSDAAFANATPRVALVQGKKGVYYSQRLHHALVRFVTSNGSDEAAYERIFQERYGLTTRVPDYRALTEHTTGGEPGTRFQKFHAEEIIRLINILEEMPRGMHKTPELRFLVRRLNGTPHPVNPAAPAVAWPDDGYIEFMEEAFRTASDSQIHRLIIHEKAHFLWAHLFDDRLRQDWIELGGWYRNERARSGWSTTKQTEFVSAYAHDENPNEDMAESIAYFIVNPDKLRSRAPAKYEFIRDRIMQGSVYLSRIREDITFEVYNLYPDYVFPGKIRRVDIRVDGAPEEDKAVNVEIELHASDPVTEGATRALIRIFSEVGTYEDVYLYPVSVPHGQPGVKLAHTFTISKYAKAGYWAPSNIRLTDAHGNERLEGSVDYGWQLYIDNPLEDVTPPQYVRDTASLRISTANRAGREVQIIHATWDVAEDKSMRDQWACFAMLNDTIPETYRVSEYGHYDPSRERCEVEFVMPHYMPSSVYSMNHITMFDQARNTRGVYFTDPDHGLRPEDRVVDEPPQRIELVTDRPDLTPPEMDVNRISVSATPVHPDAPDGETIVTVTYHVRDGGSGYRKAALYLRDPQGVMHHHWAVHDWSEFFDGDPAEWSTYTETVVLPRGSAPGTWGLAEMTVWDKAGNIHRYDFTEIVHVDVDCATEEQARAGEEAAFSALAVTAVTKVPCLPTFEVAH